MEMSCFVAQSSVTARHGVHAGRRTLRQDQQVQGLHGKEGGSIHQTDACDVCALRQFVVFLGGGGVLTETDDLKSILYFRLHWLYRNVII